jgi:hypothetical protein
MDKILVSTDHPAAAEYIAGRDDRAEFQYHWGSHVARTVLHQVCPMLNEPDADWLHDKMIELHQALYGTTLFELHLRAGRAAWMTTTGTRTGGR